jgi:hypothetical protein
VVRVTNLDTGTSRTENISGPGTITFLEDGTVVFKAVGNWLIFTLPTDNPPSVMFLNSGHVTISISPDGILTVVSRTGHMEDLCAALV